MQPVLAPDVLAVAGIVVLVMVYAHTHLTRCRGRQGATLRRRSTGTPGGAVPRDRQAKT